MNSNILRELFVMGDNCLLKQDNSIIQAVYPEVWIEELYNILKVIEPSIITFIVENKTSINLYEDMSNSPDIRERLSRFRIIDSPDCAIDNSSNPDEVLIYVPIRNNSSLDYIQLAHMLQAYILFRDDLYMDKECYLQILTCIEYNKKFDKSLINMFNSIPPAYRQSLVNEGMIIFDQLKQLLRGINIDFPSSENLVIEISGLIKEVYIPALNKGVQIPSFIETSNAEIRSLTSIPYAWR